MKKLLLRILLTMIHALVIIAVAPIAPFCVSSRKRRIALRRPRLLWGLHPIINFAYWNQAMRKLGHDSVSVTLDVYPNFDPANWDKVRPNFIHPELYKVAIFLRAIVHFDVVFMNMDGFVFGNSFFRYLESGILRFHGIRIVILPYGGDQWIYNRIRSLEFQHVLQIDYPLQSRRQSNLEKRTDYWNKHADLMVPALCGVNGMGRWDVLTISPLHIDTSLWKARSSKTDSSTFKIVHFPNHRGVKGTEYIIGIVDNLRNLGYPFELVLLENVKNNVVRQTIANDADVVVENIVGPGHGLSAIEAMALGVPTIINCEDDLFYDVFRNFSFFGECPLVSAHCQNLGDVLVSLYQNQELRAQLALAGIEYVEKYHSYRAAQELFSAILMKLANPSFDLINFFHPLKGFYSHEQRIVNPLKKNRIK